MWIHLNDYVGPPLNVNGIATNITCPTSVNITWNSTNSTTTCGPELYNVTLVSLSHQWTTISNVTFQVFDGLMSDTTYNISVAGINLAGIGEFHALTFTTTNLTATVPGSKLEFIPVSNYCLAS